MQTFNAIPYLAPQAPPKTDYSSQKSSSSDQKQESFAEALDQKVEQTQQDTGKTEEPGKLQQEGTPEAKPEMEQQVAAMLWMGQNPILQKLAGQQADGTVVQQQGEIAVPITDGKVQTGSEGMVSIVPQHRGTEQAGGDQKPVVQAAVNVPKEQQGEAMQTERPTILTNMAQSTEPAVQTVSEEGKTEVELVRSSGQETVKLSKEAMELVQPTQREAVTNTTFEMPKPGQAAKVDVRDVRAGMQNLAETIAKQAAGGKNEIEIWLEPANLGKLSIKVAYEGGKAAVSIMCMSDKAMEVISQNAKQLGTILEQHTGTNTVVVVDQPETDYLDQRADQDQGGKQQQGQERSYQDNEDELENQSFLQQLRLGLM